MLHDGPVHQCFSSSRPHEDAAALATAVIPPSMTRCDVERRSPTGDIAPGTCSPDDLDDVANKMDDLVSGCAQNVPTREAGQGENTP